jgi:hypothetical protein
MRRNGKKHKTRGLWWQLQAREQQHHHQQAQKLKIKCIFGQIN